MLPTLTRLLQRGPRYLSISKSPSLTAKHSIYVSQSTDPYFNLSFEDWYVPRVEHICSSGMSTFWHQAVQREADSGATPAHLSRQTMRRDWTKSKSLEGSELSRSTPRQHPFHTPAQWWRNGLSRTPSVLHTTFLPRKPNYSREGHRKYELLYPSSAGLVQSPRHRAACLARRALTRRRCDLE
jgi:hypothetical protein